MSFILALYRDHISFRNSIGSSEDLKTSNLNSSGVCCTSKLRRSSDVDAYSIELLGQASHGWCKLYKMDSTLLANTLALVGAILIRSQNAAQ